MDVIYGQIVELETRAHSKPEKLLHACKRDNDNGRRLTAAIPLTNTAISFLSRATTPEAARSLQLFLMISERTLMKKKITCRIYKCTTKARYPLELGLFVLSLPSGFASFSVGETQGG